MTALELGFALLGGCLLAAAGISVQTARSMARPLSVLIRGSRRLAEDPVGEQPVEYRGRNDEFADVVRSLNALRGTAVAAHERATETDADNTFLVRSKDELTAERDRLRSEYTALREHLEALSGAVHGTFVNLALRTLGLVERQLGVIEGLEEREQDPDRLATLFKLDHLATRSCAGTARTCCVLAGAEHVTAHHSGPVPLSTSCAPRSARSSGTSGSTSGTLPPHAQVAGFAADDLSHLIAELLENATSFSPPDAQVELSGWLLESGEVMLSVQDEGIGMTSRRLAELNARLSLPDGQQPPEMEEAAGTQSKDRSPEAGLGWGSTSSHGSPPATAYGCSCASGSRAASPRSSCCPAPAAGQARPARGSAGRGARSRPGFAGLPGSVAEANSNALPARRAPTELSGAGAAGEAATEAARPEPESEPEPEPEPSPSHEAEPEPEPEAEAEPEPNRDPRPSPSAPPRARRTIRWSQPPSRPYGTRRRSRIRPLAPSPRSRSLTGP